MLTSAPGAAPDEGAPGNMTRLTQSSLAAITVALLLVAPRARAEEVLRASGTGSALGALRRLGDAFAAANPGHRLKLLPSVGTGGAIAAVANGALDIGVSGRPLDPAELALGLAELSYARTPFVFGAGPNTGIRGVTTADLVRIYRGETTAWPSGERVRVVMRPRADVDTALLRAISPELSAALDAAYARPGLLVAVTNQECDEILSRTPGAIGPTTLTEIVTEKGSVTLLAWNGSAPTLPNLASGAYPLSKTLRAVTRAPASGAVQRFLAFLRTPAAARILEETGNLPLAAPAKEGGDEARRR